MSNIVISSIWLHEIDQVKGTASVQTFSQETDVSDFVRHFAEKIKAMKSRRAYRFPRETSEVRTLLLQLNATRQDDASALVLAEKLASAEKRAQEKYGHLQDIQSGHLLLVLFQVDSSKYALVAKVDFLKVLEKSSLKYREGLPVERYVMKACLVEFSHNDIHEIVVSDSNTAIAAYWYSEFLGLEALRDDTSNTKTAFDAIEKLLTKLVKPASPSDFRRMRSGVLGYMKNKPAVVYADLIETVFGTYEPNSDKLNVADLKGKLLTLPEKAGFDTQFQVDPKPLSNKRIHTLTLTNELELTIKDDDALVGIVKPILDGGRKAIKIYSESGYDYFQSK